MSCPPPMTRTYDEWREILDRELGVLVLDDEGRRRCRREGRMTRPLTRSQAESYYAWNSFVRRPVESGH